ncbi:hypothetical protein CDD80_3024 [Ophiocordyceps camponoti-rufipedis]|uniref:DUF4419 domain-containing protein n=1 Tax=Ophiocordyceps camponoti-rufipedis TaxID=2004952 RepID=A0A2C5ZDQ8_9HYPO|nr:hypothetical protein CDD80_3024 [Ophiocordyceps camponoti-rufipedis]
MRHDLLIALSGFAALTAAQSSPGLTIPLDKDIYPLPLKQDSLATSATDLLSKSCPEEITGSPKHGAPQVITSTSYPKAHNASFDRGEVFSSSSSFVRGVVEAWGQHQHLVLRPDEVWFEILVQLNYYIHANAEKVRHLFVGHQGKQEIRIKFAYVDNWAETLITMFTSEIKERVKLDWLASWIKPGFSTTTPEDDLTAGVLMMGMTQHYNEYFFGINCGLPSVTLLGTRADWAALLEKLERFELLGEEPAEYARVLRPILKGFIETWDDPEAESTKEFWSKIVNGRRQVACGGSAYVTGWITGFYYWDRNGKALASWYARQSSEDGVKVGYVRYLVQDVKKLPISYAKVPVYLVDYPKASQTTDVYLLAGNIGVRRTVSDRWVTAKPLSGWFIYGPVDHEHEVTKNPGNSEELSFLEKRFNQCEAPHF